MSRAFFSASAIEVQGLPWCKDAPKRIGIGAAVAHHLCARHNSVLSPLDAAVGDFAAAIRRHLALCEQYSSGAALSQDPIVLDVDAIRLERWLLKTTINLCVGGERRIGQEATGAHAPDENLVRIVFGLEPFPNRSGMYVAAHEGMRLEMVERFSFSPLIRHNQTILGGFFTLYGVRFVLVTDGDGLNVPLSSIPRLDRSWWGADLKWRFEEINVTAGDRLAHTIKFRWS